MIYDDVHASTELDMTLAAAYAGAILPYLRLGHVPRLYAAAYLNSGDLLERKWWLER